MKRITSIEIENFRAFYSKYPPILLPKGENLLIYGENGSGKSSLFKAVSNFFASSRNPSLHYVTNYHQASNNGELVFVFNEYDAVANKCSHIGQALTFGSSYRSTISAPFMKEADLIKGFLDYRSLLDVYNHRDKKPNLFELIVTELLLNYIPPGGVYAFGTKWKELEENLRNVYNRNELRHKRALRELPNFEAALRTALDRIFLQLNALLIGFFKFNLRVGYRLRPMLPYNYVRGNWHITADLRLELNLNGIEISDQSDYLNEARLSALSVCLYLAIMMRNPQLLECKILFLDDVFVGLDAGNRLPILNILQKAFSEYQIFISTYDRHWFELAKRHFEVHSPERWRSVELYVGSEKIEFSSFTRPIVVNGESNYDKAVKYLHDRVKPDYPASANYFRKSLEEVIQKYIPKWETADTENTQIPDYQLTSLVNRTVAFLEKTDNDSSAITDIKALLPALLHPLSHHEIASPVYKSELLIIENSLARLTRQLIELDVPNNFKCCLENSKRLKMTFEIDRAKNHYSYYELILKDPVTLTRNLTGMPKISAVHCVADKCYGINGLKPYPAFNPDKNDPTFNYSSLANAYERIYNYLVSCLGTFTKAEDYFTTIEYHDGVNWQPFTSIVVW